MKRILSALAVAAAAAFAQPAAAAALAGSGTIALSAKIDPVCIFTTAADLTFDLGTYSPNSVAIPKTKTLGFQCTKSTATPTFAFQSGANFAGGRQNLKGSSSNDLLPYTIAAGNITGSTGVAQTMDVTVTIDAGLWNKSVDTYSDTVVVDINL